MHKHMEDEYKENEKVDKEKAKLIKKTYDF